MDKKIEIKIGIITLITSAIGLLSLIIGLIDQGKRGQIIIASLIAILLLSLIFFWAEKRRRSGLVNSKGEEQIGPPPIEGFVLIVMISFMWLLAILIIGNSQQPPPTPTTLPTLITLVPSPQNTPTPITLPTLTNTTTIMPSSTSTPTFTPTFTPTHTLTLLPTNTPPPPTTVIPDTPTQTPYVTIDNHIQYSTGTPGPRVDMVFSAHNMSSTYRPMVVVKDWTIPGNLFGWVHIEGAGNGTYTLTGITIGTVDADCGQTFTIYAIMTTENRGEGKIDKLPLDKYMNSITVVRQC